MPISQRKAAGDLTGRQAEKLADQKAAQLAERAGQISTINPIPEAILTPNEDAVSDRPIVAKSSNHRIRVNADLDDVTIGQNNIFTFKRDTFYNVSDHVYNHLEEKGLIYH